MQLAQRLELVVEPQTIKMAKLGRELRSKGIDVIDLSLGEPDFHTPTHICNAATDAMAEGFTKYTPVAGYPELREAISAKLKRDNNLDYPADQIIVSTGAKQSLANIILSVVDPGAEVVIPTPYWVTYSALAQLAEADIKYIPCSIEEDYKLTPEQLDKNLSDKTRLFIFSSPCNPSGSVYSKSELTALAEVFKKYPNCVIISDEIYEYINYTGQHESIAQFEALKDQVVVVNGMSKGFAMTGWRIGYAAGPKDLIQACEKLQGQFTSGTNSIAQRASIAALTQDMTPTHDMTKAFRARRDFVLESLNNIEGIKTNNPQGAFYAFPDISYFIGKTDGETTINNDEDFCMYLLHKAHISSVMGTAFGAPGCFRISFATSMEKLEAAMQRMKEALEKLQ